MPFPVSKVNSDPSATILLQCCPNAASESANDMALSEGPFETRVLSWKAFSLLKILMTI
jgi:hypothetical protein